MAGPGDRGRGGAAGGVGPASVDAGLVLAGFWREKRTRVVITTGGARTRRFLRGRGVLLHPELDDAPARRKQRANWFRRRRAALGLLRGARVCGADFAGGDGREDVLAQSFTKVVREVRWWRAREVFEPVLNETFKLGSVLGWRLPPQGVGIIFPNAPDGLGRQGGVEVPVEPQALWGDEDSDGALHSDHVAFEFLLGAV